MCVSVYMCSMQCVYVSRWLLQAQGAFKFSERKEAAQKGMLCNLAMYSCVGD